MERMLQLLDEIEDTLFCLPLLWTRIRGWLYALAPLATAGVVLKWLPAMPPLPGLLLLSVAVVVGLLLVFARGRLALTPAGERSA